MTRKIKISTNNRNNNTMAKKDSLSDTGNTVVKSAIAFGKLKNTAMALLLLFVGALLFVIGLYYAFIKEETPTVTIEGECLNDSEVHVSFDRDGNRVEKALTEVKWTVDGVEYTKIIATSKGFKKGDLMKIEYVVGVPGDAWHCCRMKNATWGYIMMGIGILFLLFGAGLWYFRNNEFLAAGNALGTFSN